MIVEIIISITMLIFGLTFLKASFLEFYLPQPGIVGYISSPHFYSLIFSVILIILCVILTIKSILRTVKRSNKISIDAFTAKRVTIILISTALYIYCFDKVSFFITTLLYLSVLILYLNPQLKYKALLYAILGSFIAAIVFPEFFKIMVPVR
jgi:hypothetical protein